MEVKINVCEKKCLNISLKILIFCDVCGPHWTFSQAAGVFETPDPIIQKYIEMLAKSYESLFMLKMDE